MKIERKAREREKKRGQKRKEETERGEKDGARKRWRKFIVDRQISIKYSFSIFLEAKRFEFVFLYRIDETRPYTHTCLVFCRLLRFFPHFLFCSERNVDRTPNSNILLHMNCMYRGLREWINSKGEFISNYL